MVSRHATPFAGSAFVVALALLTAATPALAQNSAAADVLYRQGKDLMKKGKFVEACPKLEASQKLDAGGGTEVALGECYEGQKKYATAWSHYDQARVFARRAQKADKERELDARMAVLEPKIPKLVLKVPAAIAALPGLEVRQDGTPIGRAAWGIPLPVDAGPHSIVVAATGKVAWSKGVDVAETGTTELHVGPLVDGEPAKPASDAPRADAPANGGDPVAAASPAQRYVGYTLGAVGIVAAATGAVLALKGASNANAAKTDQNTARANKDQTGLDAANSSFDSGKSLNTTGWVITGVGAASLVAGVVVLLTAPSDASTKSEASWRLVPQVSPGQAGVSWLARW